MRWGVAPDDSHYVAAFPFQFYNRLDERDLGDIKAFLDSLPAVSRPDLKGAGSTALVAYLSGLCSPAFTATQYALLSSLAAVGRTMVASSGGVLADKLGWVPFFILTTVATIPALVLLIWIARRDAGPLAGSRNTTFG